MSEGFSGPDLSLDTILGVLLTTCMVIGLIGNVLAFSFFLKNKHQSLPDKVYCVVACVDIITNLTAISTISFLFNARVTPFCTDVVLNGFFLVPTRFSTKMSMFLVAILSTTRSIAIVSPLRSRDIRSNIVMRIIAGFAILVLLMDLIPMSVGWVTPGHDVSGCNFLKFNRKTSRHIGMMIQIIDQTVILSTSLTVFISFSTGVFALWKRSSASLLISNSRVSGQANFRVSGQAISRVSRRVTITITLFTALFLICNLPYCSFYMLMILKSHIPTIAKIVAEYDAGWFRWSGPIIFILVPVSLNAALNPCLYMFRMPRFRAQVHLWSKTSLRKLIRHLTLMRRR